MLGQQRAQVGEVLRPAHERHRDVVHAQAGHAGNLFAVALADGGGTDIHTGKVNALVAAELSAKQDRSIHPVALDSGHFHRKQPIVEEDPGSRTEVCGEPVIGRGNLPDRCAGCRGEYHLLALIQDQGSVEPPNPDAGTLQVHQDRGGLALLLPLREHLAKLLNPLHPNFGRPVR